MIEIQDLNIKNEVLPIFNNSLNKFTEGKIIELLHQPLDSVEKIQERQHIFKAFIENRKVLEDYSYTVLYLNQVHAFISHLKPKDFPKNKLQYFFEFPKDKKSQYKSDFSLMILFFHRLYTKYFLRIDLKSFPPNYRKQIEFIIEFLHNFHLKKYENIIREKELTSGHILELVQIINNSKDKIETFWKHFFLFEAFHAISQGFIKQKYNFPNFNEERKIQLEEFYHPSLQNPVKNTLEDNNNVLILNGPNMSGKSTLLKSIAICVYLSHLGFAIPAKSASLSFFQHFFIHIHRHDDLLKGYSHFMKEILNLKNAIKKSVEGQKVFGVFDELFSATNAEDAYEISKTTLNGLGKFQNSFYLISTHLTQLKTQLNQNRSNYHLSSMIEDGKPKFTYKLQQGWSDLKVGKILFECEGLSELLRISDE